MPANSEKTWPTKKIKRGVLEEKVTFNYNHFSHFISHISLSFNKDFTQKQLNFIKYGGFATSSLIGFSSWALLITGAKQYGIILYNASPSLAKDQLAVMEGAVHFPDTFFLLI